MRLPIFLAGFFFSVAVAAAIGMAAGFSTGKLILFVIAVAVVLQLAYVAVVALLAANQKRKRQDEEGKTPATPTAQVPQETDA
ncbi:hypothetical protein ABLN87_20330 [Ruegeria sp. SCPT10]|uniref:hypothetical protein n=1 Tax=Ruegeria sp. SCP10 TaxID=3141377 RepID=UPI00333BA93F